MQTASTFASTKRHITQNLNDILTLVQEGAKVFPQVSSEPPSTLVDVLQPDHADKTVVLYRGDAAEEKWKFR